MKDKDVVRGLQILMPYYDDPDGYHFAPVVGRLLADATDRPLSDEDLKAMKALGWEEEEYFSDWVAYF